MRVNLNDAPDHILDKLVEWSEEAIEAEKQQK